MSDFQLVFNLFVMPPVILLLTGPVAVDVYLRLRNAPARQRAVFWAALAALIGLAGVYAAYNFSSFFPGPGCFITVFTLPAIVLTLLWARRRWKKGFDQERAVPRSLLLIALLQVGIPLVALVFAQTCNALNRRAVAPVITALEAYRQQHGEYPAVGSQQPVDEVLPVRPTMACALPAGLQSDWYNLDAKMSLYPCSDGLRVLVPLIGSDSMQIYDVESGTWGFGSSFDGLCR